MHTPLTLALDQARADWIAGDPDAWIRYTACLKQVAALRRAASVAPVGRPALGPLARQADAPRWANQHAG